MASTPSNEEKKNCLICKNNIPKNGLINHVAEHINYLRHRCTRCPFKCVLVEAIVDHQNQTGHKVEIDAFKNWYMERICQMVYCDFDYAHKYGAEVIKKAGPVFADRERLLKMLKAEEMKQELEIVTIEEADDGTMEMETDQQNNSIEPSNINTTHEKQNKRILVNYYNNEELLDPNPGCSQHSSATSTRPIQRLNSKPLRTDVQQNTPQRVVVQTAAADSSFSNDNLDTGRQLAEIHRKITKGIEKKKCKICTQNVANEYSSQKKHVLEKHMTSIPVNDRQYRFAPFLEKCFKQQGTVFITNDLQCNICGREYNSKASRYHHVSTCHTDYRWACIFKECNYELTSFTHFGSHMNYLHGLKSHELEEEEKDQYIRFKAEFDLKLTPLVRKCFPFDLSVMAGGKRLNDDAMIDEITSNIMPSREIPQRLAPRVNTNINNVKRQDDYQNGNSSDESSDDDKKPPEITENVEESSKIKSAPQRRQNILYKNGNQPIRKNQINRPNFKGTNLRNKKQRNH